LTKKNNAYNINKQLIRATSQGVMVSQYPTPAIAYILLLHDIAQSLLGFNCQALALSSQS